MPKRFLSGLTLVLIVVMLTTAAWNPPAVRAAGNGSFSDMAGHWAAALVGQATAAGYVAGYPDGTFRPNAPVTRAESVKLLVAAGQLGHNLPYPVSFSDVPERHWVLSQGYLNTAAYWNLVSEADGSFRPDQYATRLDLLTMLLRLLGAPYDHPPAPTAALPFTDSIPESGRAFVKAGLDLGLVSGYPDGTFRPNGTVTRAEAIALIQRTLQVMTAGDDQKLHLVVNGRPVPDAVLAVRNGVIYAPGNAIYMDPRVRDWRAAQIGVVSGEVANDRFTLNTPVLVIESGRNTARLLPIPGADQSMPLAAPTYRRFSQTMMPVAQVGGLGAIPYGEAAHDPATGTVSVTFAPDWPGARLAARPDQIHLVFYYAITAISPNNHLELALPRLQDQNGYDVTDREHPPFTYSVDPAGPLRLQGAPGGGLVTSFTAGPENGWQVPQLTLVPTPAPGSFSLTISAASYTPATVPFQVSDPFPHQVALAAGGSWRAGETATLRISLLDRGGRQVPYSYVYNMAALGGTGLNPDVRIVGPGGQAVAFTPVLAPADPDRPIYEACIISGAGSVTFSPPAAGSYQIQVVVHDGGAGDLTAESTFVVAP